MKNFFRITIATSKNTRRTAWVEEISPTLYRVLDKNGDARDEIFLVHSSDIIKKQRAVMNNKYAEFEIQKEATQ